MTKRDQRHHQICATLIVCFILQNAQQLPLSRPSSIGSVCLANIQSKFEGRCCANCPKGQYMSKPCTDEDPNNTQCTPCGPNTFTAYKNLRPTCFPHNKCRGYGKKMDKAGNATADYVCSCTQGLVETVDGGCRRSAPTYQSEERPATPKRDKTRTTLEVSSKKTPYYVTSTTPKTTGFKEEDMYKKEATPDCDDCGEDGYKGKGERESSGGLGKNESITIVVGICIVGFIIVIAIVMCRKSNQNGVAEYKNPNDRDTVSDGTSDADNGSSTTSLTDMREPGSGASASSSDTNLMDFGEPSEGSSPALGINDTMEPSSEASNLLGEKHFPGIPETGKAKTCTSLNDLRQNLPNDD